jgi:hypothetical protein
MEWLLAGVALLVAAAVIFFGARREIERRKKMTEKELADDGWHMR